MKAMEMMGSWMTREKRSRIVAIESGAHASISALLEPLDLDVIVLDSLSDLLSDLETPAPDIVFVDLDGSAADGEALCTALRDDAVWWYVPIVLVGSDVD